MLTLLLLIFQKRAKAQHLLEKVFDHLELIEKDYFGLQFLDLSPDPDTVVREKMVGTLAASMQDANLFTFHLQKHFFQEIF